MQNIGGTILDRAGIQAFYLILAAVTAAAMLLTLPLRVKNTEKVFG
jgi:hypothetical protein